jgi:ABC-2 type transport system ATP-binding protein
MSLVVDHVSKTFGPVVALDGVSFEAEPGRIFGLLGANGAGKTTSMRIVLDILRPDSGSVRWQGRPNIELPRDTWGYLPEERGLYMRMKVIDVLRFFAALYGVPARDATRTVEEWLERFHVPEYRDRKVEELSKGNQQKIQFIAAILHDPDVLIMDEPFSGLDPVNVGLLKEAFIEMRDRGKTLIFSTHQMETVEELCEAICIVDRGRVVVSGALRDVKRAMGRQVVRLATDGDGHGVDWLTASTGSASPPDARTSSSCASRTAPIRNGSSPPPSSAESGSRCSRSASRHWRRSSSSTSGGAPTRASDTWPRRPDDGPLPERVARRAPRVPPARRQPHVLHRHRLPGGRRAGDRDAPGHRPPHRGRRHSDGRGVLRR